MNNIRKIFIFAFLAIFSITTLFAGGKKEMMDKDGAMMGKIVVASKVDTEAVLLGTIIIQVLEEAGFDVENRTNFGTTDVIRKAIISGEIDIYPEYTGNGAFFFPGEAPDDVWKDRLQGYETVKALDLEANGIVWLQPGVANNTWAIAIRNDLAEAEGLRTMDDLGEYISNGGEFKLAASEEFVTRDDVLPAFERTYGFTLNDSQLLTFSGGNTILTEQAAAEQTDGVNAAMAYGTDGQLAAFNLKVMEDSKGVQPIYVPAPIVRREIFEQYPELDSLFESIFTSLDLETLQALNASIAVDGRNTEEVAREYLESIGAL